MAYTGAGLWTMWLAAMIGLAPTPAAQQAPRRVVVAAALDSAAPPVIDGRLDDTSWSRAAPLAGFWQFEPNPRQPARCPTSARVLYDREFIYVGMRMDNPRLVRTVGPVLRRDDEGVSDWAFVEFDSRADRRTAFSFGVNPAGSRVDGVWERDGQNYDYSWDAAWIVATASEPAGWSAEFRIPFSQLPHHRAAPGGQADGETWSVNFFRNCVQIGERSNSSPQFPDRSGVVSNFDTLRGLDPPGRARREMLPYLAWRAGGGQHGQGSVSSGADLTAGLTPSLTLAIALNPDFGQVEVDPALVNITAFEAYLPERRPLFIDGASFLSFAPPLLLDVRGDGFSDETPFYSRRIGQPLLSDAGAATTTAGAPTPVRVTAAAKAFGMNRAGWSLGALGVTTEPERTTQVAPDGTRVPAAGPRAVATVVRAARDWKERSSVGMLITNLRRTGFRDGTDSLLSGEDRVAGLDGRHRFGPGRQYEAGASVLFSDVRGTAPAITAVTHGSVHLFQRPDAPHLSDDTTRRDLRGSSTELRLAKLGGALTGTVAFRATTPGFEMNGLGFQRSADWLLVYGRLRYEQLHARAPLRRWALGSEQLAVGWTFGHERRATVLNVGADFDLQDFSGGIVGVSHERPALATEWLRGGPALVMPARSTWNAYFHTDLRRRWRVDLQATGMHISELGGGFARFAPALWVRLADPVDFSIAPVLLWQDEPWQYVATARDSASGQPRYVVGRLRLESTSVVARGTVAINPRTTLNLYLQPFTSSARFDRYAYLVNARAAVARERVALFTTWQVDTAGGTAVVTASAGPAGSGVSFARPDESVRQLNATAVLRLEFGQASTAYLVVTQRRYPALMRGNSGTDVPGSFNAEAETSVALKVSWWMGR